MSSLLQGFEYDIFISYRHNDNRSGWVTEFVKALQEEIAATIKEPVSIYFDTNPHDGLLDTHNVDKTLENKLKCLVFIPIISQTYCDPKSFAWQHEFCAFNKVVQEDRFGRDIKLSNGNVTSRILPVKIHDLDPEDKSLIEREINGVLRAVEFIFKSPGVNRPLGIEDPRDQNLNKTLYRDQINKVANAIKVTLAALANPLSPAQEATARGPVTESPGRPTHGVRKYIFAGLVIILAGIILVWKLGANTSNSVAGKSIAVLPFVDLSPTHDQEHFGDGMADEIINSLSQIKNLKVPGRSSTFWFKNKAIDLKEVGDRLHVKTVLQGSVRKQGEKVKITVQLTNVEDGYNIWSEIFERSLNDVFAIEEEIANEVIKKLKVTLLQHEKIDIAEGMTRNPEAYDAFLKGRYFWNKRELTESERYFKQAIKLDTTFAMAYGGLAETYVVSAFFYFDSPNASMPKAEAAAKKAIQLNSSLSIPFMVLAFKNAVYDWNPGKAREYFEKSIELNPNYSPAHYWYGQFIIYYTHDVDQGVLEMRKAVELDPMGSIPNFNLGMALIYAHRYEEAKRALLGAVELSRVNHYAQLFLADAYALAGNYKEAKQTYRRSSDLGNDQATAFLISYLVAEDSVETARKLYSMLQERSKTIYVSKYSMAMASHFLGNKEQAHDFFRKSFEDHDVRLIGLVNDPYLGYYSLLEDPRNFELVKEHFSEKVLLDSLKEKIF